MTQNNNWPWYNKWQYNGAAPMEDILEWCHVSLPTNSYRCYGWETIEFYEKESWMMFMLRWS